MLTVTKARLWGSSFLIFLFAPFAVIARANDGFIDGGGIPCFSKLLTGYPCPGCGLTRAFASISHLDLAESLRYNPEALLFTVVAIIAVMFPARFIALRNAGARFLQDNSDKKIFVIAVSTFISLWILNIIRVSTGFYPTR
jgi:hypothetical protein